MADDWHAIRLELARLARTRRKRFNQWSSEIPCEWNPFQVINPETGIPFGDASAWHFIANLLETDHPFQKVNLRVPPGAIAYETEVSLAPDLPKLYIKVQSRNGRILGRSFHISVR